MLYDFGPRLLKLRKDKNLTQQMVVERAKGFDPNLRLSDSVLGKYESDLAVPRLTEAAALADVLNVSLDYLTSGEKCNVLSLKELSPEQVQLLMDLTAHIRTKKRRRGVMVSSVCILILVSLVFGHYIKKHLEKADDEFQISKNLREALNYYANNLYKENPLTII